MVFDNLSDNEKVYWLNYLLRMEALHADLIHQLDSKALASGMDPRRCDLLKKGNLFQQHFYAKIKEDLYPLVSKKAMTNIDSLQFNYDKLSTFSFGYLVRDWGTDERIKEQKIIAQTIEQKLHVLGLDAPQNKALFWGCGTGRYAVDVAHRYTQVEAFDASVLMIWCIEYLQKVGQWDIVRKVELNCRKIEDTLQAVRLEMSPEQVKTIESKVHFFVANAVDVPLEDCSINHLYSIYFTDVLPLDQLYAEIDRLLVEDGLFIHFGPLEYFFHTEKDMLTVEEIKLFFIKKGYHILVDEFIETTYAFNPNSMRHKVYDNWFFIAQKPIQTKPSLLCATAILTLNDRIVLEAKAMLEEGKYIKNAYAVSLMEQSYQLPEIVYELLLALNGRLTLEEVFEQLDLGEIEAEDKEQLMAILQELLDKQIIQLN